MKFVPLAGTAILGVLALCLSIFDGKNEKGTPALSLQAAMQMGDDDVFASQVQELELKRADDVIVLRQMVGGEWEVSGPQTPAYAADPQKVAHFLEQLSAMRSDVLVSSDASQLEDMGLSETKRTLVRLKSDRGETVLELGGYRSRGGQYVKLSEKNHVWLIPRALSISFNLQSWEYGKILELSEDEVSGIQIQELSASGDPQESWLWARTDASSPWTFQQKPEKQWKRENLNLLLARSAHLSSQSSKSTESAGSESDASEETSHDDENEKRRQRTAKFTLFSGQQVQVLITRTEQQQLSSGDQQQDTTSDASATQSPTYELTFQDASGLPVGGNHKARLKTTVFTISPAQAKIFFENFSSDILQNDSAETSVESD